MWCTFLRKKRITKRGYMFMFASRSFKALITMWRETKTKSSHHMTWTCLHSEPGCIRDWHIFLNMMLPTWKSLRSYVPVHLTCTFFSLSNSWNLISWKNIGFLWTKLSPSKLRKALSKAHVSFMTKKGRHYNRIICMKSLEFFRFLTPKREWHY